MHYKKKAFTLIELSVVLLVIAALVAGLLVSQKIITRAKVQALISEIDHTQKAAKMFYDSYTTWPGNISQNLCKNNKEFSSQYYKDGVSICDEANHYNDDSVSSKYIKSNTGAGRKAMLYLKAAGFTDSVKGTFYRAYSSSYNGGYDMTAANSTNHDNRIIGYYEQAYGVSSVVPNVYFTIRGETKYLQAEPGMPYLLGDATTHIAGYYNASSSVNYKATLDGINYIFYQYFKGDNSQCTKGYNHAACVLQGAIPAHIMLQLDKKLDDGLPTTGNLLAFKPANISAGENEYKGTNRVQTTANKYCYNTVDYYGMTTYPDTVSAEYVKDTSQAFGCNFAIVL